MKIAFVSDTHGNLPAFQKVLEHMETQEIDIKVHLGDIVGYGPYPNECVELTVKNFNYIVKGNHDEAAYDTDKALGWGSEAKDAILWTNKILTAGNKDILKNLEKGYVTKEGLMYVHGSPREHFGYVINEVGAMNAFGNPMEDFRIAFIGHTHVPIIWKNTQERELLYIRPNFTGSPQQIGTFNLGVYTGEKAIINVGSVGQPRDIDVRACYAIFDTEHDEITYFRIPYSIDRTVGKMQQNKFSTYSWSRLLHGQ